MRAAWLPGLPTCILGCEDDSIGFAFCRSTTLRICLPFKFSTDYMDVRMWKSITAQFSGPLAT